MNPTSDTKPNSVNRYNFVIMPHRTKQIAIKEYNKPLTLAMLALINKVRKKERKQTNSLTKTSETIIGFCYATPIVWLGGRVVRKLDCDQ